MKIGHILNMANNGYHICNALRDKGVDAELVISSSDFGMGLPMWEELELEQDPYHIDFKKMLEEYPLPEWIKIWNNGMGVVYAHKISELLRMSRKYDLVHLHATTPLWYQYTQIPFVIHESGWIRAVTDGDTNKTKLARRAYTRAACIVMTNPDTYELLKTLKIKREKFIPFAIPTDKYKPISTPENEELLFLHPTRQTWDVKGNDRLLEAFRMFLTSGYLAHMIMIDWGWDEDVELAKQFLKKHGLEENVTWIPPYSKPNLIKVYNQCDAVFDQFLLGSGGTVCYESMSCAKPTVIYLNEWNEKCFGEMPPVVNVRTSQEIYEAMILLTDQKKREYYGKKGREFVLKHNHPPIVANQLIKLYEEII